jgi:peptidoglycan-N-acetylglucosamine deacetylase
VKRFRTAAAWVVGLVCAWPAIAEPCENPNALGTSRTIAIDPSKLGRIGSMQYQQTIALAPKEVVLTFDDGPILPHTSKVLEALRAECVKATFFVIGRHARLHPEAVQQMARDGHTVANHTENHLLFTMGEALGIKEFEIGFASIAAALAPMNALPAPFIRFPGLFNSAGVEAYAKRKNLAVMSADLTADDWLPISGEHVFQRAIGRLGLKGSGVLLLHDAETSTAQMLPKLLTELKTRGYRVVHLVPAPGTDPEIPSGPLVAEAWAKPFAPVRHVVRVRSDTKLDATNNYAPAEASSNYATSVMAAKAAPAPAAKAAAATTSSLPEGPVFGRWRKVIQEGRSAAITPASRPD